MGTRYFNTSSLALSTITKVAKDIYIETIEISKQKCKPICISYEVLLQHRHCGTTYGRSSYAPALKKSGHNSVTQRQVCPSVAPTIRVY